MIGKIKVSCLFSDLKALLNIGYVDNLELRLVVRNMNLSRQTPLKASEQSLLNILKLYWWLIRDKNQLLARHLQVVEDVEEGVLSARLAR